jgi:hypothetical protein
MFWNTQGSLLVIMKYGATGLAARRVMLLFQQLLPLFVLVICVSQVPGGYASGLPNANVLLWCHPPPVLVCWALLEVRVIVRPVDDRYHGLCLSLGEPEEIHLDVTKHQGKAEFTKPPALRNESLV